ncbi:protein serine/threonine phosphatase 2C [Nadsonia fulvescens var. elongata DSM 6958]|uniref:Protein serine/threonine phosphatase 2C n=1 Tax=Nadsonia fulvescens var. elongata DSM 6958 TaxID=857566 RepID=A0A1E3PK11_9ASCO|nr:protein serine/threonine phosphatase 2C [Nadsonia fulvescens var. elongata DSM 6958]
MYSRSAIRHSSRSLKSPVAGIFGFKSNGIIQACRNSKPFSSTSCSLSSTSHKRLFGLSRLTYSRKLSFGVAVTSGLLLVTANYVSNNSIRLDSNSGSSFLFSTNSLASNANNGTSNKYSLTLMSPEKVTAKLRENEISYLVERNKGVVRYDISQLASNNPIEDDRSEGIVKVPLDNGDISDWMFWCVFDGHSGWTTSAKLRDNLINYVMNELKASYTPNPATPEVLSPPNDEAIVQAIKSGFSKLDDEIINQSVQKLMKNPQKSDAAALIAPALSGSCGLMSFYDTKTNALRVAVTGDSRAVLGHRDNYTGGWLATALSIDQTGSNPSEANRIRNEHPGEESVVIRNGRVLGSLEPSRAFGDARYKWTKDVQEYIGKNFFGRRIHPALRSPPYVTAEPEVTTTTIYPENGDFLVMASDGLYEMLSNDQVVSLVVQWMENNKVSPSISTTIKPENPSLWSKLFASNDAGKNLNVIDTTNSDALKAPIRRRGHNADPSSMYVVEDKNAATHLVRNALGGKDREQVNMLVSIPSGMSRSYRDDLTVTVVFFGQEPGQKPDESGGICINHEATHGGVEFKSKL